MQEDTKTMRRWIRNVKQRINRRIEQYVQQKEREQALEQLEYTRNRLNMLPSTSVIIEARRSNDEQIRKLTNGTK